MDRIDALRVLLDGAAAGSFSSTACQRGVATSTVAMAVEQLEKEFGAELMTRSPRKLTFTPEGDIVLGDAPRIVDDWDGARARLKEGDELEGPIRVTATNDFGRSRLRPLLDRFQALHPGVRMSLRHDPVLAGRAPARQPTAGRQ
ncbi:LysR family transcriptional regulator [Aquincola tertiaricarbonis]|uniref:LysR family transcriptional regulator n=1 Tax=Aquincola tertiaricarbonis TaxID=391953 RepID=UPI00069923CD|nr:LysR family transcriptional regulator [Aquincola tertiaricarbonis]